jgi:hypothetical protein
MIHPTRILLTAALSLLSVLTSHTGYAQAVPTQTAKSSSFIISSLPYSITSPGTYVLTSNLTYFDPTGQTAAIGVSGVPLTGPVVINLKGFTLTGSSTPNPLPNAAVATGIALVGGNHGVAVTIENGTIKNYGIGVASYLFTNVTLNNLIVSGAHTTDVDGRCVRFFRTSNSFIKHCTFSDADYGIQDYETEVGNSYMSDSFTGIVYDLSLERSAGTIQNFHYEVPTTD